MNIELSDQERNIITLAMEEMIDLYYTMTPIEEISDDDVQMYVNIINKMR